MTHDEMLSLCRHSIELFNDPQRREGYFDLYADDVVLHGYTPEPLTSKEAVRAFYQVILDAYPDCAVDTDDIFPYEDRVAWRFRFRGTDTGGFMGATPSGRPFEVPGITILRFAGDRCAERWSVTDFMGLMVQVGAVAPPGGASA